MHTLEGFAAIDYAEENSLLLSKHSDPTEPARDNLTVDEAHDIAWEDFNLIYLEIEKS